MFPDPDRNDRANLHRDNFRVVLHDVILTDKLTGSVHEPCKLSEFDTAKAQLLLGCSPQRFRDGSRWLVARRRRPARYSSRLARNRMHWEGPQLDRPNERPYALHRNGYAGMQRYASFLMVGRRVFQMGNAQDAGPDCDQHFVSAAFPLGNRHRRLRADNRVHG